MTLNVEKELAALQRMTPKELREKYAAVFGEASRSGNKEWLVKRIIWRLQANAEGDLSERSRKRAMELANDSDIRMKAPLARMDDGMGVTATPAFAQNKRLPLTGSIISREYKGSVLQVTVRDQGFEYEGERYKSLSAVAKKITGSHCNGFLFFRLGQYGGAQ